MNMKRMCVFLLLVLAVSGMAFAQNATLRRGVYISSDNPTFRKGILPDTAFDPNQGYSTKSGSVVIITTNTANPISSIEVGQISGNRLNITARYSGSLNNTYDPSNPYNPEFIIINSQTLRIVSGIFGDYVTYVWNHD
jgi:hypothetical protein